MSLSRVTRKTASRLRLMPGKRSGKCMRMTVSSGVKTWRGVAPGSDGSGTKRGSTAGTCTTANSCSVVAGPAQHHGEVERFVEQVRKRMAWVDGQRRQHREDLALKHQMQMPFVGVGEVLEAAQDDAFAFQGGQHRFLQTAIGLGGHAPDGLLDAFELFLDGHVVGAGAVDDAGLHFLLQGRRRGP